MHPNDPSMMMSAMSGLTGFNPQMGGMMNGDEPAEAPETGGDETKSGLIEREVDDVSKEREALIKEQIDGIKSAKSFFRKDFARMRENMRFVSGKQWGETTGDATEKYVANITQRHLQQKVAALYAKNPKVVCKRRPTMDFAVWDESEDQLQSAMAAMQGTMNGVVPLPPEAQMLVQDIMQGMQTRKMHEKQARTLELLFAEQIEAQEPAFKLQMKQLVRRTCVTGVGFVKLGFQRMMEKRPEDVDKITDITQQIVMLERLLADKLDEEIKDGAAELEKLKILLQQVQNTQESIVKEGLVFDFPASTSVIVDPKCRNIRTFLGAQWVAQEFILSTDDVKEIYKKDVGKDFIAYKPDGSRFSDTDKTATKMCVVWELYSKTDGMMYVLCDGYKDYLEEPTEPHVKLERFWPLFSLTFNEVEDEQRIYPQSDVELIMPMQREYNRSRQALREQRIANRPLYAVPAGVLDEKDIAKLETRPNNAVIILNALQPGARVGDIIQPVQAVPIENSLYETDSVFSDLMKVAGTQEANLGGVSGGTATESSIAESSRSASIASNVDDLDDFLSEMARSCGQILLMNMSTDMVKQAVGQGAVWAEMSAQEAADMIYLEIAAGSSGRPNKAAESANFQQLAPLLMQIPGINPEWLLRQAVVRMDDRVDPTDAILAGAQSIVAMNMNKQLSGSAGPEGDPNAQGAEGGNQGERPQEAPPQPEAPNMASMA